MSASEIRSGSKRVRVRGSRKFRGPAEPRSPERAYVSIGDDLAGTRSEIVGRGRLAFTRKDRRDPKAGIVAVGERICRCDAERGHRPECVAVNYPVPVIGSGQSWMRDATRAYGQVETPLPDGTLVRADRTAITRNADGKVVRVKTDTQGQARLTRAATYRAAELAGIDAKTVRDALRRLGASGR